MKSPLLRLTQSGKTVGIRADAILAVTLPSEGRTGSLLHLSTRGTPSTLIVDQEPEKVLQSMDEALGYASASIRTPSRP